jgi:hypothetical protein
MRRTVHAHMHACARTRAGGWLIWWMRVQHLEVCVQACVVHACAPGEYFQRPTPALC